LIKEFIETKITQECDVLVCGGGVAGISAALAAARQGKKVTLLEKQFMLGGLATAGLVVIYLPLCDGEGNQVSFGIGEELLRLSISMGAEADYPDNWLDSDDKSRRTNRDKRFSVRFNPSLFAILAEQELIRAGVNILYGTYAVGTHLESDKINAVIIENKSGRQAIKATSVVDATGDCDIANFACAPTTTFKQGNILAAWYYSYGKDGYQLNPLGCCDIPDEEQTEDNKITPLINERFTGLDGAELSKMTIASHASTLNDIKKKRKEDKTAVPTTIATTPQIRMTRKIVGEYVLGTDEQHTYFDDSIGMVSDWRKRGPVYEVPFRTLYSKDIKNLIVAGRCTSVSESLWDVMRVIPCCAVTGQAAGTAAAMSDDFSSLDIKALQDKLKTDGVILHEKDL